jgi:ADP-ribose pyrophosphatase YjhB (NUDIX family)
MKFCPECRSVLSEKILEGGSRSVCDECGYVDWRNPSPVAAGIVLHKGKVVLVRTSYHISEGTWGLPGGYVERGETAEHAIVRETREETELDLRVSGFVGTYFLQKKRVNLLYIVFWGEAADGDIKAGGDVEEADAFTPEKVLGVVDKTSLSGQALSDWMDIMGR